MGWLSFLCPLPRIIRAIVERELVPAVGLVCGGPDDAVMGCISAVVRRESAVGRTLGIHAE